MSNDLKDNSCEGKSWLFFQVHIDGIGYDTFLALLEYIYTDRAPIEEGTLLQIVVFQIKMRPVSQMGQISLQKHYCCIHHALRHRENQILSF